MINNFGDTARSLARNPLGIIALFIVLVYGIAGYVFHSTASNLSETLKIVLVVFIVVFPLVVLATFVLLVTRHHTKLYGPSDFRSDNGFLQTLSNQEKAEKLEEKIQEAIEPTNRPADLMSVEKSKVELGLINATPAPYSEFLSRLREVEALALRTISLKKGIKFETDTKVVGKTGSVAYFDGLSLVDNTYQAAEFKYSRGYRFPMGFFDSMLLNLQRLVSISMDQQRTVELTVLLVTERPSTEVTVSGRDLSFFRESEAAITIFACSANDLKNNESLQIIFQKQWGKNSPSRYFTPEDRNGQQSSFFDQN